ncbi:uncharacterized protein LOC143150390 [Ptiloglossa arizonensis]|uniref:uncharacterized protein LOC143150390 n=1 Tax=Ptiloglossa arizonensis TaxID=3350558 RepID=UPI003F9FE16A
MFHLEASFNVSSNAVIQAPWIWNKQLPSSIEDFNHEITSVSLNPRNDNRGQRVTDDDFDLHYTEEEWLDAELEERDHVSTRKVSAKVEEKRSAIPSPSIVSTKKTETTNQLSNTEPRTTTESTTQSRREEPSRISTEGSISLSLPTAVSRETETTRQLSDIKSDKLIETSIVEETGHSSYEFVERERMETPSRTGTNEEKISGSRIDFVNLQDKCDSTCPRRISRKSRIRKLEERQNIVDTYLLNKGTRYFEDICTCSLSCVVRALRDDPFIRSILTSVALFTLGLKLCSELDAWYLPIRLS